jgi:hypothetical protein
MPVLFFVISDYDQKYTTRTKYTTHEKLMMMMMRGGEERRAIKNPLQPDRFGPSEEAAIFGTLRVFSSRVVLDCSCSINNVIPN